MKAGDIHEENQGLGTAINAEIEMIREEEASLQTDDLQVDLLYIKKLSLEQRFKKIKQQKRTNIEIHMYLTFFCQMFLICMTYYELIHNPMWNMLFSLECSSFI